MERTFSVLVTSLNILDARVIQEELFHALIDVTQYFGNKYKTFLEEFKKKYSNFGYDKPTLNINPEALVYMLEHNDCTN